jgi:hypothetical protein
MSLIRSAAFAAIAAALLVGCEQRQQTTRVEPAAEPPVQASANAAATSTSDPSLPPADRALESPKTSQDAAYSATTPAERDTQMPMKGQANDYNTPDRAKEADQPNTASKEPGGQEARPGNQPEQSMPADASSNTKETKQ